MSRNTRCLVISNQGCYRIDNKIKRDVAARLVGESVIFQTGGFRVRSRIPRIYPPSFSSPDHVYHLPKKKNNKIKSICSSTLQFLQPTISIGHIVTYLFFSYPTHSPIDGTYLTMSKFFTRSSGNMSYSPNKWVL